MSPIVNEPVKKESQKEPIKEPEQLDRQTFVTMSEEDSYIYDRMKSQPKTIDEVLFVKERRYAPGEHRLSLPKEFLKYEDRFAFRWINKKKRGIDEALLKGWVIVNRFLFPDEARDAKHLFSTSGAVEKGDAVLSFMKKEIAESIRKIPGEKSTQLLKSQLAKGDEPLPKGKSGFYKPDSSSEKEDDSGQGMGLQEGRDF